MVGSIASTAFKGSAAAHNEQMKHYFSSAAYSNDLKQVIDRAISHQDGFALHSLDFCNIWGNVGSPDAQHKMASLEALPAVQAELRRLKEQGYPAVGVAFRKDIKVTLTAAPRIVPSIVVCLSPDAAIHFEKWKKSDLTWRSNILSRISIFRPRAPF